VRFPAEFTARTETTERIPVGVSSCLLGEPVRYDGGHKHDRYVTGVLGRYFEYVPWCPEALAGLGVPRPPIRLVGDPGAPRAVRVADASTDVTDALLSVADRVAGEMGALRGYIFKRGSPSCGMARVKVYDAPGKSPRMGQGVFARTVMRAHPLLPCEEEGRLNDAPLRESFVERVFAYDRWLRAMAHGFTPGRLVAFHTEHKFLLLAHSEVHYRAAGRLVADAGRSDPTRLEWEYLSTFMEGMRRRTTRRRHSNVLQHLAGFLKRSIDEGDRRALADIIDEYRSGAVPLVVPIRFLRHHFRRAPDRYVEMQHYLAPYPDDLGLRNHL
jgi:uncharacterized protein YbgA (DUF1722 family)/uncharacterized protein YbbK (DUF523 family)